MIHFAIPSVPPSSNNAYFNLPGGGRTLTKEGKKFKTETKAWLAQKYMKELTIFVPNVLYLVYYRFWFLPENFYNKTYGKKNGAESRYKKLDVTNRAKLLEDVIKDVSGVDDSNNRTVILEKKPTTGEMKEHTEVFIWNTQQEESPFDELLARI